MRHEITEEEIFDMWLALRLSLNYFRHQDEMNAISEGRDVQWSHITDRVREGYETCYRFRDRNKIL